MISRGDYYEDCGYHPRICIYASNTDIQGVSLVDGTISDCSIRYCRPKKITQEAAIRIRTFGPYGKKRDYLKQFYAGEWGAGRKIWWPEK